MRIESAKLLKGNRLASDARDLGSRRTIAQPLAELAHLVRLSAGENFHPSIRQVSRIAGQPQAQRVLAGGRT